MFQLSRYLLLFLVTAHSFVWAEEIVVLIRQNSSNFKKCNPCRLTPMNQSPFLFGYSALKAKERYQSTFRITLNKSKFQVTMDKIDSGSSFPFYQIKFLPDYRLRIYGILSSQGVSNKYYHYFLRQEDLFHYLGYLPQLVYDQERKLFIASEKDGPHYYRSNSYRLKKNRLLLVRASKLKDPAGP